MADEKKGGVATEAPGQQVPPYPGAPPYPQGAYGQAPPPYQVQPTTFVFPNTAGQQPAYVQHVAPGQVDHSGPVPNDHLKFAIITTICCFWPTGILAILKAVETRELIAHGDIARANESSRKARMFSILALCIGLFLFFGIIVYGTIMVILNQVARH
ncbi:proline-rich transmembrane protein 1-like [Branchiostoma lanceolatum]|uniref:proline-rich transmembrane protein 1-like n=1 Tax=Branchiostoma lanceolatum TaxID=7740 RepID=UPI003453C6DB